MDSWVESIGRREQHNLLYRSKVKRLTNLVLASSKTSLLAAEMKLRPCLIGQGKGRGGRQGELVSRVGDRSLMDVIAQWNSTSPVQHNVIIFDNVSVTPKNRGKVWPLSCQILLTDLF